MNSEFSIGIIPDIQYSPKWVSALKSNNIAYRLINLSDICKNIEVLKDINGLMWRWGLNYPTKIIARIILDIVENENTIKIYPNYNTRYSWDDKIKQYFIFKNQKIRTPDTYIFFDHKEAVHWSTYAEYPLVFKLSCGASSRNVTIVKNSQQAKRLINKIFQTGIYSYESLDNIKYGYHLISDIKYIKKKYFNPNNQDWMFKNYLEKGYCYFQEFIPNNQFDTRITIIGNRAFAFKRFNRENDFRASGSGHIDYNIDDIDTNLIKYAFAISKNNNYDCMAYDFIYKNDDPVITEMCWTFNDEAIYNCNGYFDNELNWNNVKVWPENLQVLDFLNKFEIKNDKRKN